LFLWVLIRVHEVVAELREGFNGPPRFETMPPSIIPCNVCVLKAYLNGVSYFASLDYSGKLIVESVFEGLVRLTETRVPKDLPLTWVHIPTSRLPLKVKHVPPPSFPLLIALFSTLNLKMFFGNILSESFLKEKFRKAEHTFSLLKHSRF